MKSRERVEILASIFNTLQHQHDGQWTKESWALYRQFYVAIANSPLIPEKWQKLFYKIEMGYNSKSLPPSL